MKIAVFAALFCAGVVLFAIDDQWPGHAWLPSLAQLVSAIGSAGMLWIWLGRKRNG